MSRIRVKKHSCKAYLGNGDRKTYRKSYRISRNKFSDKSNRTSSDKIAKIFNSTNGPKYSIPEELLNSRDLMELREKLSKKKIVVRYKKRPLNSDEIKFINKYLENKSKTESHEDFKKICDSIQKGEFRIIRGIRKSNGKKIRFLIFPREHHPLEDDPPEWPDTE